MTVTSSITEHGMIAVVLGMLGMSNGMMGANANGGEGKGTYEFIKMGLMILGRFYYHARVSYPDSMFIHMLEWLSEQKVFISTRGVSVYSRFNNLESEDGKPDVKLLPTGTQYLWYKGYLLAFKRDIGEKRADGIRDDVLEISVFGGSKDLINDLLHTAMEYSINLNKDKTKIFSLDQSGAFWECISIQNKRTLDSVILDENISEMAIDDISSFVHGKKWYMNTGVPYRRGYLLYGPPGSGKTSFILAVADRFGKSISIMNMSKGIHDGNIHGIIQKCQKNTILVLEDIDAAFVKRNTNSENAVLTFSGLLNAIDGLASSDGRILMMTTNHIDRLSPALIRPGRVDLKVKFDYATSYQIIQMHRRFFPTEGQEDIIKITNRLSDRQISTAQIQGWFILHRHSPKQLLESVDEFLEKCLLESSISDDDNTPSQPQLSPRKNITLNLEDSNDEQTDETIRIDSPLNSEISSSGSDSPVSNLECSTADDIDFIVHKKNSPTVISRKRNANVK
eukprot:gene1452-1830_t